MPVTAVDFADSPAAFVAVTWKESRWRPRGTRRSPRSPSSTGPSYPPGRRCSPSRPTPCSRRGRRRRTWWRNHRAQWRRRDRGGRVAASAAVGPTERSSAWCGPWPYHPCVYTVTEVVDAPVVKVVESCFQEAESGVQVETSVVPVPVAQIGVPALQPRAQRVRRVGLDRDGLGALGVVLPGGHALERGRAAVHRRGDGEDAAARRTGPVAQARLVAAVLRVVDVRRLGLARQTGEGEDGGGDDGGEGATISVGAVGAYV